MLLLVTLASGILISRLVTSDFRFSYVAEHSNRTMPLLYQVRGPGGAARKVRCCFGRFWLSLYAAVVVFTNRRTHRDMMPWVVSVLTTVQTFFLILNNFIANPFRMLAVDKLITRRPRRQRSQPAAAIPGHGHPPADVVPGLCGIHGCRSPSQSVP